MKESFDPKAAVSYGTSFDSSKERIILLLLSWPVTVVHVPKKEKNHPLFPMLLLHLPIRMSVILLRLDNNTAITIVVMVMKVTDIFQFRYPFT